MREQRNILTNILLVASLVILATGLLQKGDDTKIILLTIGGGLFIGVFIERLFKGNFGYKPSREEIENRDI